MINQNIEFIRAYFLSFDEEEQEKIFSSLSDEQKDLIVEAGVVFLSNGGVETISDNSSLIEHKRELKEVQLEYFIGLADILAAGGTNEVIGKLRKSKNLLFEEVLAEFKDNTLFENDLLAGIRSIERKDLKQDLSLLDKEEGELGIPDQEVKYAISKIERKALKRKLQEIERISAKTNYLDSAKYSVDIGQAGYSQANQHKHKFSFYAYAASVAVILLITGVSLFIISRNSKSESNSYSFNFSKKSTYSLDVYGASNSELKSKYYKAPVFISKNQVYGFDKSIDSISILVNNLSAHILELRTILEYSQFKSERGDGVFSSSILKRIDSLEFLYNTYSFIPQKNSIVLNLSSMPSDFRLIIFDLKSSYNVYVRLDGQYYLISENNIPNKLNLISDHGIIEKLKIIKERIK